MSKLTLSTISSRYASVAALNANFQAIVTALENTLSRDGTTPNTMSANLDMNSNRIINADDAINNQDVPTLKQLNALIDAASMEYAVGLRETQTATGGQTVFTLSGISYNPGANNLAVYVNGIRLHPTDYTETSSTVVTMASGLSLNDEVVFYTNEELMLTDPVNIAGGTINATTVGLTTPAAGSFTTLSATTDFSVTAPLVDAYFTSSTGTNRSIIRFVNTGGSYLVGAEDSVGGSFGATAYDGAFYVPSGKGFSVVVAGTGVVQRTTSTGLAVTGLISAIDTTGATQVTAGYSGSAYSFIGHNNTNGYCGTFTNHPFILRVNNVDVATLSSTGLSVTGALSASGTVTSTAITGFLTQPTTGTDGAVVSFMNTGGTYSVGVDNSAGGIFGDGVYSMTIRAPAGKKINNIISGTGTITSVSSTGLAVTGALSATGAIVGTGADNNIVLSQNGSTQWRINNSNAGTAAAANLLLQNGTAVAGVYLFGTGYTTNGVLKANSASLYNNNSAGVSIAADNAGGVITFASGGLTERMRIDSSGNVGIGISPSYKLQVSNGTESIALSPTTGTNFIGSISNTPIALITGVGLTQVQIAYTAGATNYLTLTGSNGGNPRIDTNAGSLVLGSGGLTNAFAITGSGSGAPILSPVGAANLGIAFYSAGTGAIDFGTAGGTLQVKVAHTASADRYITITGSNGGNPTISTSAGSLAITPNIVCSGAVYTGSSNNAGIENNYAGVAANANIDLPKHVNGGLVVVRDNSSGGTALALVDEATGVTIVSDPVGILATADPGAGGNKFWLQCNSVGSYTRITNRFGSTKNICFTALATVMVGP